MRRKVKLFALLASVFAIGACEDLPELPQNGVEDYSDIPLNINAVPAGDFSRATDTAFETGDAISVFGYKGDLSSGFSVQTWLTNGKFTKGANGFTSAETHYWYSGEELGHIVGLYPYSDKYTAEEFLVNGVSFYVKSDQSTHANYTASDLMYAIVNNVTPTANEVVLEFNHVLSKLVVDIDNQSSASIKDVYVSGVFGGATYSMLGGYTIGNSGTIKAGKLANASQGYTDSYTLIIPPQQEIPNIAITTTNDKQYTFSVNEPIEFNSGKARHLKVTITEESVSTEIDATIRDWSADEDVEFSDANNPGGEEPLPDYLMMEKNPNWELTVIENYYDEGSGYTYPAVVELIATDDMAYNYVFYYKDYWESLTEEERLMELTNYAAVKSAILIESITTYKQDGIDVTAKDLYYYGSAIRTLNFSDGEYIACIVGFNDDGTIAYKYACSNYFTYANPVTEEYLAWCGTWEITDGTNSYTIEISQREPGRNYWVEGWEGVYGVPFVLDYNASGNYVRFGCQQVATNVQVGDSIVDEICMWGLTNFGNYQNSVYVVDGYMQDENTAVVESKMYYDPENPEYFIDFFYVLINDGNPYYGTNSETHITFPATMTRIASAEPAAKHELPIVNELPTKKSINPIGLGYFGLLKF
ncbi:MAG: fimbrillin family protein [Alistipes sp.]|nr:fimbrillin family protein [Alistipes sp.]